MFHGVVSNLGYREVLLWVILLGTLAGVVHVLTRDDLPTGSKVVLVLLLVAVPVFWPLYFFLDADTTRRLSDLS